MRIIRDLAAAFLFGLLLLWAVTAHACGFGYSASYVSAYSYAPTVSYYVPQVAYAYAYAAPATYTYAAAAPCPPVAEVQAPAPVQAPAYVPETMPYATAAHYGAGLSSYGLNSYGYHRSTVVVEGRRNFFRRDVAVVEAPHAAVVVEGRRSFFGNAAVVRQKTVTRSVTRTRTTLR